MPKYGNLSVYAERLNTFVDRCFAKVTARSFVDLSAKYLHFLDPTFVEACDSTAAATRSVTNTIFIQLNLKPLLFITRASRCIQSSNHSLARWQVQSQSTDRSLDRNSPSSSKVGALQMREGENRDGGRQILPRGPPLGVCEAS